MTPVNAISPTCARRPAKKIVGQVDGRARRADVVAPCRLTDRDQWPDSQHQPAHGADPADERVEVPLVRPSHRTHRREEDDHADRADPDDQPPSDVAGHGERECLLRRPCDRLGLTDRHLDEADRECRPPGERQPGPARHPARPAETEAGEKGADDHEGRTDDTAGPEVRRDVVERRHAGRDARGGSARADVDHVGDCRHQGGDRTDERRDEHEPDAEPLALGGNAVTSSSPSNNAGAAAADVSSVTSIGISSVVIGAPVGGANISVVTSASVGGDSSVIGNAAESGSASTDSKGSVGSVTPRSEVPQALQNRCPTLTATPHDGHTMTPTVTTRLRAPTA